MMRTESVSEQQPPTTRVSWVGVGLDDEVGFELTFEQPVAGRFPTTSRIAHWVQGHRSLSAELVDLPAGVGDLPTVHLVLSSVARRLRGDGFREVAIRRFPDAAGEREVWWCSRPGTGTTDHRLLVGVCTQRSTIATLRMSWTSAAADPAAEWPEVRALLDQWKVTVR